MPDAGKLLLAGVAGFRGAAPASAAAIVAASTAAKEVTGLRLVKISCENEYLRLHEAIDCIKLLIYPRMRSAEMMLTAFILVFYAM